MDGIIEVIPVKNHTVVTHFSNEDDRGLAGFVRTQDFPTQILRTHGDLKALQISCTEVNDQIDAIFVSKISHTKYTYNTYISCSYDTDTKLATYFSINSYFDPLSDAVIDELKAYLSEVNGREFLGTTFQIESARGIIIALNVMAGTKINASAPLVLQRQDRNNYFFKSNYEMRNNLVADIYQRFYSTDPELILPFLKKWLYAGAEKIYYFVLRRSNYIEMQPERIFLMQNEGDIFVSDLRYNFAHTCTKSPSKKCL